MTNLIFRLTFGAKEYGILFAPVVGIKLLEHLLRKTNTQETSLVVQVQVSPNPVLGGQVRILSEETVGAVRILNTQGQIVQNSNGNAPLNLIGLPKGLYIVQIAIHGQWIQRRIVVQ